MENNSFLRRIQELEAKLSQTTSEKDRALESARSHEHEKYKVIQATKVQDKEKGLQSITQSHSRFSHLNEISSCEAFWFG